MNDNTDRNIDNPKPEGINVLQNPKEWRATQVARERIIPIPPISNPGRELRQEAIRLVAGLTYITCETPAEVVGLAETVRKYIEIGIIELPPVTPPTPPANR